MGLSNEMTKAEQKRWEDEIDSMSQTEMARLWRFAPSGHPIFDKTLPLFARFEKRFKGFTPEISKSIGWGE